MDAVRVNYVRFRARELVLAAETPFALCFSNSISAESAYLVIDIYDLDNSVHPEGHVGWWKFPVPRVGSTISGAILTEGRSVEVSLEGERANECWINGEPPEWRRLIVNAVLRSRESDAIVHVDRIPCFRTKADLETLRSGFNRDWRIPRYAALSYVIPAESAVRIVARDIFPRDAVGNFCLDIFRMLVQQGVSTAMYAENYDLAFNDVVRGIDTLEEETRASDLLLYFFSTYDPFLEWILQLSCQRRVAYFHGVTRPELLREFDAELSAVCEKAISQIPKLRHFDILATNSRENSKKLVSSFGAATHWSLERIHVIPPKLLHDLPKGGSTHSSKHTAARLLYVGRIKGHKKIEHVLELFSEYLALDDRAECWIVGSGADRAYSDYLASFEKTHLKIPEGRVRWFGSVDDAVLNRLYASATAFVSMSEDEGFCLPVLEAMLAGIPVFVYGLPAVREVMSDTGCYFDRKDFKHLAAVLHRLINDARVYREISDRQYKRAVSLTTEMDGRSVATLFAPSIS